jgi:hypothetical protein
MMRILVGALLLFQMSSTFAQQREEWRVIPSVTEWLEEINNWPDSVYKQENLEVLFDHDKDKGHAPILHLQTWLTKQSRFCPFQQIVNCKIV